MTSSLRIGLISAFLLASLASMGGCYEPPKVQEGGAGGGPNPGDNTSSSSSSSQGGSGGGGGTDLCNPGETKLCSPYMGPAKTENVGVCKPSTNACTQSGTWIGCQPEIIPTVETCLSNMDLNCDGLQPCTGTPIATFPTSGTVETAKDDVVLALAAGPGSKGLDGDVYAVGMRNATTSPQLNDQRVLFWNQKPNGTIQDWSNLFQFTPLLPTNGAYATAVGVLPTSGDVIVAGTFSGGSLVIGGAAIPTMAAVTSFFARISPSGSVITSRQLNSGGTLEVRDIAVDSANNIYLVGMYTGTPNVPGMSLPTAAGNDGFIMRMNPDGSIAWAQVFSGPGTQEVSSIAITSNGEPVIAISFTGLMDVATPQGQKSFDAGPENDVLIGRLDASAGIALWTTVVNSQGISGAISIADIAANDTTIAIGGQFRGTFSVSGKNYLASDGDPGDIFFATLEAASGNFMYYYVSQWTGPQNLNALALDAAGDLVISGSFVQTLAIGSAAPSTSSAEADVYVVKLNSNLGMLWSRQFGDDPLQIAESVVIGNVTGHIYVGGGFKGTLSGANPAIVSTGAFDGYILQLGN